MPWIFLTKFHQGYDLNARGWKWACVGLGKCEIRNVKFEGKCMAWKVGKKDNEVRWWYVMTGIWKLDINVPYPWWWLKMKTTNLVFCFRSLSYRYVFFPCSNLMCISKNINFSLKRPLSEMTTYTSGRCLVQTKIYKKSKMGTLTILISLSP